MKGLVFLALLTAMIFATASQATADCYNTDAMGRPYRVQFDPGSQFRVGVLGGAIRMGGYAAAVTSIETGLAYRSLRSFGRPGESIRWQFDHRVAWGRVMPFRTNASNLPPVDAAAYAFTWLRHADASYVIVPTDPPQRIAFPLDVGVDVEAGRVHVDPTILGPDVIRFGVARASVVIDPVRSPRPGHSFEIGVGVRYDLDLVGTPGLSVPRTIHRLSPFTSPSLRWRWQDLAGLTSAEFLGIWQPGWASEDGWNTRATTTRARLQRTVIAINDEPVALVFDGTYVLHPAIRNISNRDEFCLLAGISVGMQLR